MPACRRRRSTPTSTASGCRASTTATTRGREAAPGERPLVPDLSRARLGAGCNLAAPRDAGQALGEFRVRAGGRRDAWLSVLGGHLAVAEAAVLEHAVPTR